MEFDLKLSHIGMNASDDQEAMEWAKAFSELLGLEVKDGPTAVYSGDVIEIKKNGGRGAKGHIGFSVNDCEAALKYFEEKGVGAVESTKKFDSQGKCNFAYLDREIGGFAIHLMQE
ncbi:MAG TPA: VOC family protein [Candidatus Enterocloster faecavium]|uniref:VOC family protein n=1 Tax=Candidatus Enterocloster faecavium TaxID=2838560 RepID=A0A9D2L894_9FIRM|nr:VOC family protein [Candidatus Enterocloster faecavium]